MNDKVPHVLFEWAIPITPQWLWPPTTVTSTSSRNSGNINEKTYSSSKWNWLATKAQQNQMPGMPGRRALHAPLSCILLPQGCAEVSTHGQPWLTSAIFSGYRTRVSSMTPPRSLVITLRDPVIGGSPSGSRTYQVDWLETSCWSHNEEKMWGHAWTCVDISRTICTIAYAIDSGARNRTCLTAQWSSIGSLQTFEQP